MRILRPAEARDDSRDWLELTQAERKIMARAAEIAEQAAALCEYGSDAWLEWQGLAERARDAAKPVEVFAPFGVRVAKDT